MDTIDMINSIMDTINKPDEDLQYIGLEFVNKTIEEFANYYPLINCCRCMDLDGDGFLSMYELEYFYEEQLQRMEALGIETLPFYDCLCQVTGGGGGKVNRRSS